VGQLSGTMVGPKIFNSISVDDLKFSYREGSNRIAYVRLGVNRIRLPGKYRACTGQVKTSRHLRLHLNKFPLAPQAVAKLHICS
jgi:hypothetical protein